MKTKTAAFDSSALPQLSALVGDRSALMAAAKLATALSQNPVALVATAIALLDGPAQSNRSLGAIGLDADALGRAACLAHRSGNAEDEQIANLVRVLMLSRIAPAEQQIIAQHLSLLSDEQVRGGQLEPLVDFTEEHQPGVDMLKSPAAWVWLASPVTDFADRQAWQSMEGRPDLAAVAIANPGGFLSHSAKRQANPCEYMDLSQAEPDLLAEYLGRVSKIDSSEQALYVAARFLDANELQGPAGARHRAALIPFFQNEMAQTSDVRGEIFTGLAKAAHAADDRAFAHAIARMSDNAKFGYGPGEPLFIFHPSGVGGIDFPDPRLAPIYDARIKNGFALPIFTWADYILAFGGSLGPGGSSERSCGVHLRAPASSASDSTLSFALDYLADSMQILGLDKPILARGSPSVFRDLAAIALRFPKESTKDPASLAAMSEAVSLRLSLPAQPLLPNVKAPRL